MNKERLEPLCFSRIWDYCQRGCPLHKKSQGIARQSKHLIEQHVKTQKEAGKLHKAGRLSKCALRRKS